MIKLLGENVTFQIEVEQDAVLLVFDRKCASAVVPWQDAYGLAEVIEGVIEDVRSEFRPTSLAVTRREQGQINMSHGKGTVALFVDWTDRLRFTSLDAFYLVARAIKRTAQDAQYADRGVHFVYGRDGMLAAVHNTKHDLIQYVR